MTTLPRIRTVCLWVAVFAAVPCTWAPAARAQAPAAARTKSTVIAVVDVKKVLDNIKENVQVQAEVQSLVDGLEADAASRQKELKKMQEDLQLLPPDGAEYSRREADLEQKVVYFKAWREFEQRKLDHERTLRWELLYKRMLDAVGRVAQQNGADLVLYKEAVPDFRNAEPRQVSEAIQLRKVLWAGDDLDLTSQVVQMMDNDYKARGGSPVPATQPAK
jgi:Skp family chaperone for outer membrane proteins